MSALGKVWDGISMHRCDKMFSKLGGDVAEHAQAHARSITNEIVPNPGTWILMEIVLPQPAIKVP